MKITLAEIEQMEKRKRAQFINALSGIKSANLIGTKDNSGNENLCVVSSVVHLGSSPALLGFVQRPTSVERHTYENIKSTNFYTINAIASSFIDKAHQTSARYLKEQNEFLEVGLNSKYQDTFFAPFVEESPLQIGMKLEEIIPIRTNDTKLIIGSIQVVYTNQEIEKDGYFDLEKGAIVGITGLDTYVEVTKKSRYVYAKPNVELKEI